MHNPMRFFRTLSDLLLRKIRLGNRSCRCLVALLLYRNSVLRKDY